ncbi:unnamed protein product [Lactuca saligna]|uniref:SWIM-type domain-containing protein n=1 Tax=Lactuca saligna TaxID=75948 RepID=A0AA35ZSY3_LACSI|nr:unnamed protein product [Lactuca saligna]
MYVDHDGQVIEDWFGFEIEEEGGDDSYVDGGENEDEIDYLTNVDVDFNEDIITMNRTKGDEFLNRLCGEEEVGNDNNIDDDDDDDGHEEDANVTQQLSIFNELVPLKKHIPILGMRKRLLVKCCKGECTFRLWASWMSDESSFQIKSLKAVHKCARNYKLGSMVTYAWIRSHYTREFLLRQNMSVRKLRAAVSQNFGILVSVGQCKRARKYALQLIDGTLVEHYAKLWSYAEEIRRLNPGSIVKLDVNHMPHGKNYFSKFYVCFDALKKGWKEGCRKIIGLDGCFLKGIYKGELLCDVGRDANNRIYPISCAVVCVENKENWRWFLDLLIDDLGLNLGYGYNVISDQHKGLIEVVKELLPYVEHRQCAKHISQNLRKRYSGAQYESILWKACKATTEVDFKVVMKDLEVLDPSARQYLMDKVPKTWSRAYFQPRRWCDVVENGMSESFNVVIVDARKKPIITMLEELRMYMMERVFKKKCKDAYEVDVEEGTCSSRFWQLNGIGCVHSVAAISFMNRDVESYVDKMFSSITYMKAYKFRLTPMNESNLWPAIDYTPPLPLVRRTMPGRPATKRKRDATETPNHSSKKSKKTTQMQNKGKEQVKVSKAGKKQKCSLCKVEGHNKRACTLTRPPKTKASRKTKQGIAEALNEDDEGNQANAMNEGDEVNEGDQAANDDGGEVNDANGEPIQVHVQEQEAIETPLATLLKKFRRKKSERIIKLKLGKKVGGVDAP